MHGTEGDVPLGPGTLSHSLENGTPSRFLFWIEGIDRRELSSCSGQNKSFFFVSGYRMLFAVGYKL